MRRGILALLLFLVLLKPAAIPVWGQEETEELAGDLQEDLLNREEIKEVQKALEELLGEDSFSFFDMLLDLMNGETGQLKEEFSDLIREVFLRQLIQEKALFVEILLLVLAAALLTNFTHLFSEGQIGEVSFYVIYLLLLTMLVKAFGEMSLELLELLERLGNFMKVLSPAYCLAVAAAGGTVGSAMFYQLALFAITAVQVLLAGVVLPGINIYLLLLFVNLISKRRFSLPDGGTSGDRDPMDAEDASDSGYRSSGSTAPDRPGSGFSEAVAAGENGGSSSPGSGMR